MRFSIYLIPFLVLGILCDWYLGKYIRKALQKHPFWLHLILGAHYTLSILCCTIITVLIFFSKEFLSFQWVIPSSWFFTGYLFCYVPKFIYFFFRLISYRTVPPQSSSAISRRKFIRTTGIAVSLIPMMGMLYGIMKGRFNFRIYRAPVTLPNLPASFKGLKIVQISDTHLGGFDKNYHVLEKVVEWINNEKPDIIVHTGDLVNNFSQEVEGWTELFQSMHAKVGKYAILGNHDYGDYYDWNSKQEKNDNFDAIKQGYADCGFTLLLNTHIKLKDAQNNSIALIGVENWGEPPFSQHANLSLALMGAEACTTKILLTHNPKHWEQEVMNQNLNIALTLSGHTHGMQMGIQLKNFEWSIAERRYKRWGGLYREGDQQLYVNRGLGYVGIPMRLGMDPEITVITLS